MALYFTVVNLDANVEEGAAAAELAATCRAMSDVLHNLESWLERLRGRQPSPVAVMSCIGSGRSRSSQLRRGLRAMTSRAWTHSDEVCGDISSHRQTCKIMP